MDTSSTVKTWGQALDWQMRRWKRMPSIKTNTINAAHITRHIGRSFPLSKMGKRRFWIELQEELLDEGKSTSTVNRICSVGSTVMKETFLADLHPTEIAKFKRLQEGEHRLTWFTKDDIEKLVFTAINTFDRSDIADAILFASYTGVRQSELLKLKGRDLDLAKWQVWVGGKPDCVTKAKNVRCVGLPERIRDVVLARKDERLLFGCDWDTKDQLYYQFTKIRDHAGFPKDHCFHSLRHSYGTWLGENSSITTIAALMGHKDRSSTEKYVKPSDTAMSAATDLL